MPKIIPKIYAKKCLTKYQNIFLKSLLKKYAKNYTEKYSKNSFQKLYVKTWDKNILHETYSTNWTKFNFYVKGLFQGTLGIWNPEIIMVFGISGWQLKTFLRHLKDTFFTFSNYHSDFIQIRHSVQLGFCIFRYRLTQK